ncbi:hypothetical protein [Acinetobacter pittii]|jgi:hypothetical protein|uniref:hypothetical protein n=1 Tax=Acinetobacter pittii TaxID=48296 RepID=UPI00197F8680|nr:hypothetical protein [Acinetobacter pittii]MBN6513549.1 hypothetical protein [Acinetobacter pittii]MDQ9887437.1 hypothetical protein [Acinetobacter pittii]WVH54779.1 hypothetical protein RQL82_11705 [Acinetobacter pittii]
MSNFLNYKNLSTKSICDAAMSFDLARSAEKMMNWEYIGDDNPAWKDGPYLSSPANKKQIDRSHPYCMRSSIYMRAIAGIVVEDEFNGTGKTKIPASQLDPYKSRVEPIISKLVIIEQFELFKAFMICCDGPYNKKQVNKWVGKLPQEILDKISSLTLRRNELTHDTDYELPTMKEAVEFFYALRFICGKYFDENSPNFVFI